MAAPLTSPLTSPTFVSRMFFIFRYLGIATWALAIMISVHSVVPSDAKDDWSFYMMGTLLLWIMIIHLPCYPEKHRLRHLVGLQLMLTFISFYEYVTTVAFIYWLVNLWILAFGRNASSSLEEVAKKSSWACITGGTDGIGLAMAHQFIRLNMNVIIVGRNKEKTDQVCQQLLTLNPNVQVVPLIIDFAQPDHLLHPSNTKTKNHYNNTDTPLIAEKQKFGLLFDVARVPRAWCSQEGRVHHIPNIDIVVHAAGVCYTSPTLFSSLKSQMLSDMTRINVESPVLFLRLLLPHMHKESVWLYIGSISSTFAQVSHLSYYAVTKSVGVQLGIQLKHESQSEFQSDTSTSQSMLPHFWTLVPSYIATKLNGFKPNLIIPNAEMYVTHAMQTRWLKSNPRPTTGYWLHDILQWMLYVRSWIDTRCTSAKHHVFHMTSPSEPTKR